MEPVNCPLPTRQARMIGMNPESLFTRSRQSLWRAEPVAGLR